MKPEIIIPAAGRSSRLGHPKQLVNLTGETLIRRAVRLAGLFCVQPIVVLGHDHSEILSELQSINCRTVYNPIWERGLGSSVACGAAEADPDADCFMVLLCDQPLIKADDLKRAFELFQAELPDVLAARSSEGAAGPPVVFSANMLEHVKKLDGDKGLRQILQGEQYRVVFMDCPQAFVDIDTEEDLQNARMILKNQQQQET